MQITNPKQLKNLQEKLQDKEDKLVKKIIVCHGPGCLASGAEKIFAEFEKVLAEKKIKGVTLEALKKTGCHGLCEKAPLVAIEPDKILYTHVKPRQVEEIIEKTVKNDEVIPELLYSDPETKEKIEKYTDIKFYSHQTRIALRNLGHIKAADINEFIQVGGYQAMAKAITKMTPDGIIDEVTKSGLRGRGGGGFPTGRKWATCRKVEDDVRYVICNGDEGDPGAFMDPRHYGRRPTLGARGHDYRLLRRGRPRRLYLCSRGIPVGGG